MARDVLSIDEDVFASKVNEFVKAAMKFSRAAERFAGIHADSVDKPETDKDKTTLIE